MDEGQQRVPEPGDEGQDVPAPRVPEPDVPEPDVPEPGVPAPGVPEPGVNGAQLVPGAIGWHYYDDYRARAYWDGQAWTQTEWVGAPPTGRSRHSVAKVLIVVAVITIVLGGMCTAAVFSSGAL